MVEYLYMRYPDWVGKSIPFLLGVALIILLFFRLQVASQRFFDVDEFTHMRWAGQIFMGEKPYIDFFTFFPPGYHWMLQPLFALFSSSPFIFIAGRYVSVLGFIGMLAVVAILFARLRSPRYALLPAVILAFLPLPYDKYIEIRPDTWATFLGLVGVLLMSMAWEEENKRERVASKKRRLLFSLAGAVFSLCLLVLPKMLPFVIVAGLVECVRLFWNIANSRRISPNALEPLRALFIGGGIVGFFFFVWMLSLGNIDQVWYSLTKLGIEGNRVGKVFIMEPHLFFFPNSSFYGGEGMTISYIVNHTLWILGIVVGAIRLWTPFLTVHRYPRSRITDEMTIAGIFFLSVWGYIYFFPLKHAQYLIPIGVFVAFYAADGIVALLSRMKLFSVLGVAGIVGIGIMVNKELNARKMLWTNTAQLQEYVRLHQTIPNDAVVVDMEGKLLTWKHGYYVCCLAWGQFGQFLSRPLPNFIESLERNNVTYIYQGDNEKFSTLPQSDLSYIQDRYVPLEGWYGKLWKRK